ncbi:MAG: hypothetical protein NZ895_06190 [Archaeoglobaceae archaeon]|nr:hypothetical protein [Archaeoglobaceae archaeon]MCX8151476.1 hypothetical protein [Archaeoglobaceae archaeon]MDW8014238.1 hypothetical protein [Archaeoglobaceae archaeon]
MISKLLACETLIGISWGVVLSIYAPTLVASSVSYSLAMIFATLSSIVASILTGLALSKKINLMPLVSIALILATVCDAKCLPFLIGFAVGVHGVYVVYVSGAKEFRGYSLSYSLSLFGISLGAILFILGIPKEILALLSLAGVFYPEVVKKTDRREESRVPLAITLLRRSCRLFSS